MDAVEKRVHTFVRVKPTADFAQDMIKFGPDNKVEREKEIASVKGLEFDFSFAHRNAEFFRSLRPCITFWCMLIHVFPLAVLRCADSGSWFCIGKWDYGKHTSGDTVTRENPQKDWDPD